MWEIETAINIARLTGAKAALAFVALVCMGSHHLKMTFLKGASGNGCPKKGGEKDESATQLEANHCL